MADEKSLRVPYPFVQGLGNETPRRQLYRNFEEIDRRGPGVRVVTSSTRPPDPFAGQLIFETDTGKVFAYTGTDWAPRDAGGTLGYAQVTANQGSITTEVDLTGLSVTVTVGTSRRIKITGYTRGIESTVAADEITFRIKEGATQLEQSQVTVGSANRGYTQLVQIPLTPSAGSHTYKLTAARSAGTGTLTMAAGATAPAWILVEDIGAA